MKVVKVDRATSQPFILTKHYSRRMPVFWEAFALVIADKIEGVVIYGQPSPPIQRHAFKDRDFRLYELSRLVVQTTARNAASFLIGRSLRLLSEQPSAVVSYADSEWGHCGIVYQATNWIYTGATKSHDHAYLVDGVRTHPMTLRDKGITDPKKWARDNGIQTLPPCEKHRYFFLNGTKAQRQAMLSKLAYPVVSPYPKADKKMYDDGERVEAYQPTDIFGAQS